MPCRRRNRPQSPLCFRQGCPQHRRRWATQVGGLARAQGRCLVRVAGLRSRTRMVPALQHHGAWLVQARAAWLCGDTRWHRVRPVFAGLSFRLGREYASARRWPFLGTRLGAVSTFSAARLLHHCCVVDVSAYCRITVQPVAAKRSLDPNLHCQCSLPLTAAHCASVRSPSAACAQPAAACVRHLRALFLQLV